MSVTPQTNRSMNSAFQLKAVCRAADALSMGRHCRTINALERRKLLVAVRCTTPVAIAVPEVDWTRPEMQLRIPCQEVLDVDVVQRTVAAVRRITYSERSKAGC